jgi:hypothetical protein
MYVQLSVDVTIDYRNFNWKKMKEWKSILTLTFALQIRVLGR